MGSDIYLKLHSFSRAVEKIMHSIRVKGALKL
jgi:hypothetical protein